MLLSLSLRNGRSILRKGVQTHLYPKDRGVLIDTAAVTFQDTVSKKLKWSYSSFHFSTAGSKKVLKIDKKRLEDPRVETESATFPWAVSQGDTAISFTNLIMRAPILHGFSAAKLWAQLRALSTHISVQHLTFLFVV
ncbi:uncharacterized protein ZBIST_1689 [Zygosaccharomyces bailii]|nr:uncharacterized protein ZBAI_09559 [Zygosaccharomyces bailii ISA1307]SJM84467.1 uncharacterized protein ZBIST_1689 [Zygosaccharomyces bailii]